MGKFLGSAGKNNRLNFEHIRRSPSLRYTQSTTYTHTLEEVHTYVCYMHVHQPHSTLRT